MCKEKLLYQYQFLQIQRKLSGSKGVDMMKKRFEKKGGQE